MSSVWEIVQAETTYKTFENKITEQSVGSASYKISWVQNPRKLFKSDLKSIGLNSFLDGEFLAILILLHLYAKS